MQWNNTTVDAKVAWPQRATSLVGVNHRNPKRPPVEWKYADSFIFRSITNSKYFESCNIPFFISVYVFLDLEFVKYNTYVPLFFSQGISLKWVIFMLLETERKLSRKKYGFRYQPYNIGLPWSIICEMMFSEIKRLRKGFVYPCGVIMLCKCRVFVFQTYVLCYSIHVPGWLQKWLNLITAPGSVSNEPGSVTWLATKYLKTVSWRNHTENWTTLWPQNISFWPKINIPSSYFTILILICLENTLKLLLSNSCLTAVWHLSNSKQTDLTKFQHCWNRV